MKTWILFLLVALLASPVYAGQTTSKIIDSKVINRSSPVAQGDIYLGDADKVTFFVTYDSNRVTAAITANLTAAVSLDGINWQDISWLDVAGGVTPVTSEDLSFSNPSDGNYVGVLDYSVTAPYLKIYIKVNNDTTLLSTGKRVLGPVEAATVSVTVIERK